MAGEILKKRREDLGLNIKEIADLIKIKTDFLIAIEDDSFDMLPVAVYTMGYIRSYAKYLDVDPEPIIQYYAEHLSQPKPRAFVPIAFFPIAFSRKKGLGFFYIIPIFVVGLVAFFIVSYLPQKQNDNLITDNLITENLIKNHRTIPKTEEHVLFINADEVTWIHIKFGDSRPKEILFQPGQSKSWRFSENALLKIGNAGGIRISFDGKDLGILGESGQVITLNLPEDFEKAEKL